MNNWRDINGFPDYQVNEVGDVRSLKCKKTKTLSSKSDKSEYKRVGLRVNGKSRVMRVHQLVAIAFLNHIPDGTHKRVVNHINMIKSDNRVSNLEIISQRKNCDFKRKNATSQYTGVSFCKSTKKWRSVICIKYKYVTIGRFDTELKAHEAYQKRLSKILKDESKRHS